MFGYLLFSNGKVIPENIELKLANGKAEVPSKTGKKGRPLPNIPRFQLFQVTVKD